MVLALETYKKKLETANLLTVYFQFSIITHISSHIHLTRNDLQPTSVCTPKKINAASIPK